MPRSTLRPASSPDQSVFSMFRAEHSRRPSCCISLLQALYNCFCECLGSSPRPSSQVARYDSNSFSSPAATSPQQPSRQMSPSRGFEEDRLLPKGMASSSAPSDPQGSGTRGQGDSNESLDKAGGLDLTTSKIPSTLSLISDDEDSCPTCLEPYSSENPKIFTNCHHHFHLSCIYEWLNRKQTCPICGTQMLFEELAL